MLSFSEKMVPLQRLGKQPHTRTVCTEETRIRQMGLIPFNYEVHPPARVVFMYKYNKNLPACLPTYLDYSMNQQMYPWTSKCWQQPPVRKLLETVFRKNTRKAITRTKREEKLKSLLLKFHADWNRWVHTLSVSSHIFWLAKLKRSSCCGQDGRELNPSFLSHVTFAVLPILRFVCFFITLSCIFSFFEPIPV